METKERMELPAEILEAIQKRDERSYHNGGHLVMDLKRGDAEIVDRDPVRPIVLMWSRRQGRCFLFGLDTDGTEPFMSEVEGKPKSVKDAFEGITPILVRLTRRFLKWKRQGEVWFLGLPFKRGKQEPVSQPLERSAHRADFVRDLCGSFLKGVVDKYKTDERLIILLILLGILFGGGVAMSSFFFYFFLAQYLFGAAGSTNFILLSVVWIAIWVVNSISLFLLGEIPLRCKLLGITVLPTALPLTLVIVGSYHLSQLTLASGKIAGPHHPDLDLGTYWHLVQFNKDPD